MAKSKRPPMEGAPLDQLAAVARLPLTEQRKAIVGPALADILRLLDMLDAVELGEAPPETAFDARWE